MTTMPSEAIADYPLTLSLKGVDYVIRTMTVEDGPSLLKFAQGLPPHDILYMRRNISAQAGIDKWLKDLKSGLIHSIIALEGDTVVGYATINLTDLDWTSHVADLRVSVALRARKSGLGRTLVREIFKLGVTLGLEVITTRMTPDQKAARTLFEELGFRNEAVLKDHMKDLKGEYHDLLIMAVNVDTFLAQRQAYGLQ
jgi:RimJ/RimL family protein N-acetyltransferase